MYVRFDSWQSASAIDSGSADVKPAIHFHCDVKAGFSKAARAGDFGPLRDFSFSDPAASGSAKTKEKEIVHS
jgi:hypothetical protein